MRLCNEGGYVSRFDICGKKHVLPLAVNIMANAGISIGICFNPSVVVDAGVHWIGTVTDIVPQPTGIERDRQLNRLSVFFADHSAPVLAHCSFQPLVDFHRGIGLQPDPLWSKVDSLLRMNQLSRCQAPDIVEPLVRKWASDVSQLEQHIVFGPQSVVEVRASECVPPIWLRS